MATYSKKTFSANPGGEPIVVSQTNSPGTLIHKTLSSSEVMDEVWIYATNSGSVTAELIIQYGWTAEDNAIRVQIPSKSGLTLVIPGLILTGYDTDGREIRAISSISNVIRVSGYINRIS